MPELRIDPITGRRVFVAEDRAARPSDYLAASPPPPAGASTDRRDDCPFCRGNEASTPGASAELCGAAGEWLVRVVPNKFPAVSLGAGDAQHARTARPDAEQPDAGEGEPWLESAPAIGAHEVIIESPRHVIEFDELGAAQLGRVLGVYRDRLRHWADDPRVRHAVIFKNSGFAAGASLEHVHSQLIALPEVAAAVGPELRAAAEYSRRCNRCIYCDLVDRELRAGERIIARQGGLVAIAAFAARQPFETWIVPEQHVAGFESVSDDSLAAQAEVLQAVIARLRAVVPRVSYNLILHTAPFGAAGAYHWHWELVPRITELAGLELGAGQFINPVPPEQAAQQLRLPGK